MRHTTLIHPTSSFNVFQYIAHSAYLILFVSVLSSRCLVCRPSHLCVPCWYPKARQKIQGSCRPLFCFLRNYFALILLITMVSNSAVAVLFGCALAHSLQLPLARPLQLPTRHRSVVASVAEDPESEEARRARLEAIGREEADRKQYLDSAPADDGGLMAEFQARIDAEGGATAFKVKSNMNNVKEEASETARKAQVGRDSLVEGGERRGGGKLITRPRH